MTRSIRCCLSCSSMAFSLVNIRSLRVSIEQLFAPFKTSARLPRTRLTPPFNAPYTHRLSPTLSEWRNWQTR